MPGVEPGDLPDTGVGSDQLVAAPELFSRSMVRLRYRRMQQLVAHDDPQPRDLRVPRAELKPEHIPATTAATHSASTTATG